MFIRYRTIYQHMSVLNVFPSLPSSPFILTMYLVQQFVYPFTLEPHILAQQPPIHEKIRTQRVRYAEMLEAKAKEAETRR